MQRPGQSVAPFEHSAGKYAHYLETPEGRMRLDLAFAWLMESLPATVDSLYALDIGCGTGATAVQLAQLGAYVTLLDASLPMLDLAERAARQAGVTERVVLKHGDAAQLTSLFDAAAFDVIICHNVLEYIEDPEPLLSSAVRMLRDNASLISVLVRNRAGEVLKAAIKDSDLAAAENSLTAEWGHESLYGGKVRLFTPSGLQAMLERASFSVSSMHGVRGISDYLPQSISRSEQYERIFQLERKLGSKPEFAAVARYTQCIAHRAASVMRGAR